MLSIQSYADVALPWCPLQEARKTVTAGATFRPFPGDDWQAAGMLPTDATY